MADQVVQPGYWDRLDLLVTVAGEMGTSVSLTELLALLPPGVTESELRARIRNRPDLVRHVGGLVLSAGGEPAILSERQARGADFRRAAREFVDGPLSCTRGWVRMIGLTGSTAYGDPQHGDDIDFITVTRTGAVWVFLAYCYLTLRFGKNPRLAMDDPEWCFNYVVDDVGALRDFRRPQGFLFAREALAVRVLLGPEYYRRLLGSADWMATVIPRIGEPDGEIPFDPPESLRAPWPVRVANALVFPLLATYLQLRGLLVNDRCRRDGRPDRAFATRTRLRGIAFESARFEELRTRYERVAHVPGLLDPTVGESRATAIPR